MRPYFPQPRFAGGANFRESDAPNLGARFAPSKFERRQPKFFHRPKRLRCDSDPAGGATPQIAPPTRAPAGRGPTDARHSRHARSRSHHGHRSATVTPESRSRRLARCRAPRHCRLTVVSPLRLSTPPAVASFAFPSGGAPTGASLHLRLPLQRRRPRRVDGLDADCAYGSDCRTAPTAARASRLLRQSAPRRATGLPTPIATTAAPALGFRPARADGIWDRTIVSCGNKSDSCVYMTESTSQVKSSQRETERVY